MYGRGIRCKKSIYKNNGVISFEIRKMISISLLICMLVTGIRTSIIASANGGAEFIKSIILSPEVDTYATKGSTVDNSALDTMIVGRTRLGFMRFNLGDVKNGSIVKAELFLTQSDTNANEVGLYDITNDTWPGNIQFGNLNTQVGLTCSPDLFIQDDNKTRSEAIMDGDRVPYAATFLPKGTANTTYSIDVTNALSAETKKTSSSVDFNDKWSFCLYKRLNTNEYGDTFYTNEATNESYRPKLVIQYVPASESYISQINFADSVKGVRANGAVESITFTKNNDAALNKNPKAILVLCDGQGKIYGDNVKILQIPSQLGKGEFVTLPVSGFSFPDNVTNFKLKLFVFDELSHLMPLTKPTVIAEEVEDPLKIPSYYSSNMVLQRGENINIWGYGSTGRTVTVNFADQIKSTKVQPDGKWQVTLDALDAADVGRTLTITHNTQKQEFSNVVVGDVWVATGQSNMAWTMNDSKSVLSSDISKANYPNIRFITASTVAASTPQEDVSCPDQWQVCTPATVLKSSAVAYYFAKEINENDNVPIGLICTAWAGKAIKEWLPQGSFEGTKIVPNGNIHNGMMSPFFKYNVKGAIWYQGEYDAGNGIDYANAFKKMVEIWRAAWNKAHLPVYYVQLPPIHEDPPKRSYLDIREAQRRALSMVPDTGMAITIDSPEYVLHPLDKSWVGKRLARVARCYTYGEDIVPTGPLYKNMEISGSQIVINFDMIGTGLEIRNGTTINGFTVCGSDGVYYPAQASITNDNKVVVSSDSVTAPVNVRYMYTDFPSSVNLYNKEGLPASPFSTEITMPILVTN